MKTASFYMLIGATVLGLLLMGGISQALATPTSVSIYSDAQTYVISGTQNSTMYGTPEDVTNFYGKGAMMISAPVADPNGSYSARAMDSIFSFNTATAATGNSTSYVTNPATGVNIVAAFNAQYGAGNWTITGVTMTLASNWYVQGIQPNNDDFNEVASGNFTLSTIATNPGLSTVTWNSLQALLPTTTTTSAGTFTWTAQPVGTTNNTGTEPNVTYNLTDNPTLVAALLSGEVYFLGTAADSQVGYVFNTANRVAPEITITADANSDLAPVPVPPALWLFGSGIAGLGFIRRRFMA